MGPDSVLTRKDAMRIKVEEQLVEDDVSLPFEESVGYQVRETHKLVQRCLQKRIEPHGVTLGMWYFLRALWHEDGLTQRELSDIVGTMEPTTLTAIRAMERSGLVVRERNSEDRRKINVFLTARGKRLKKRLMPLAKDVVDTAVRGFSERERRRLLDSLNAIQGNLRSELGGEGLE
jgi:DNA-binding MarR family transcriptional regulator